MSVNFAFLHDALPSLEKFGELAEVYLHTDPNACMIKLGMMGEAMLAIMVSANNVTLPDRSDSAYIINLLRQEGLLPVTVTEAFHRLRKYRNKAAHEVYDDKGDALLALKIAHSLCEWCYNAYYDRS